VVKRAYLLGQNDENYQRIVRSISGIVFLATPHRGTDLAATLNRVLKASFQSSKSFIDELKRDSAVLEVVNEQFRHIAPMLAIVSFYETLPTHLGPTSLMILTKDSATLGYPQEVSRGLHTDHHDVCKYFGPDDPNYVTVLNMLKSLVSRFRPKGIDIVSNLASDNEAAVEELLAMSSGPDEDFSFFRDLWTPGTCGWFLRKPIIQQWLEGSQRSHIVWFSAPPASGKSVLSTYIIDHLHNSGLPCQYFFFRFGDHAKRSLSTLLRSLAIQLANVNPAFRRAMVDLWSAGVRLEKANCRLIWQKMYESVLFRMQLSHSLFWVIDGLDESESPKTLLDLFQTVPKSSPMLHILLISRKTEALAVAFDRLSRFVAVDSVEKGVLNDNSNDIRTFLEQGIREMRGSDELKLQVTQNIMDRAEGNFLWVRLVLEEVLGCHTEEAIEETLNAIPSDMSKFYQQMELAILNSRRASDWLLAKEFLQWTICARRSLTLKELSQALKSKFPNFLDLRRTIRDVCGQFIVVDQAEQIAMVHQTACDYLIKISKTEISIDPIQTHKQLFMHSISALLDPGLRLKFARGRQALQITEPFLLYAATSWPYHLQHTDAICNGVFDMLFQFFSCPSVLTWIHLLALIRNLEPLVKAATAMSSFVNTNRRINVTKELGLHRRSDLEVLDQWTVDLVKVLGKFSRHLLCHPAAIYKLVPPFCPKRSILHRQFQNFGAAEMGVSGPSNDNWDDNLVRIALPAGDQGLKIVCVGQYIAVLCSSGTVHVWSSYNLSETCLLRHGEAVTAMCLNKSGRELVTYGLKSSKLWSISSGALLFSSSNPIGSRAIAITFSEDNKMILTGSTDGVIRYLRVEDVGAGWHVLSPELLRETSQIEGGFVNSPLCIAFNADATQVGVSYRGFPLSVWALDDPKCIGRCRRNTRLQVEDVYPSSGWFAVDRFTWNPVSGHVIGLYKDGSIFKWHPVTDENREVQSTADEIAASSDGKLFVTSSSNGSVQVWNFVCFSVIYQLSSSDLVTALTFSPDSRRFYDLRWCSVNAWAPNSLIRFSESEESFTDAASEKQPLHSVSQASDSLLIQDEAVSSPAMAPGSSLYCVGKEDGRVDLFDVRKGKITELANFSNSFDVTKVIWSEDARHIACADLGGDIIVKRLVGEVDGSWKGFSLEIESLANPKIDLEGHNIHQLLFSCDSRLLLIITEDCGHIWEVKEGMMRFSASLESGTSRKWLRYPGQQDFFLGFGANDVKVYGWCDFNEHSCFRFRDDCHRADSYSCLHVAGNPVTDLAPLALSMNPSTSVVNRAIVTHDGKSLLVEIRDSPRGNKLAKRLLIFDNKELSEVAGAKSITSLTFREIPPEIVTEIQVPLGILAGSRFVFLDHDFWVCTFELGPESCNDGVVKRHYFIPADWINSEALEQCCIMEDGAVLFPRDDKVAVIRSSLITGF
jgi:WD40 repeat protein